MNEATRNGYLRLVMAARRYGARALILTISWFLLGRTAVGVEPTKENWVELPSAEAADAMEMIAEQTHGNYLRIKTWVGKYAYREHINTARGAKKVKFPKRGKELLVRDPSDPILERVHEGSYHFAIRMDSAQLYAEDECPGPPRYFEYGTGKTVDVKKIGPQDRRSLVTPEHSVLFQPLVMYGPIAEYVPTLGREQRGPIAERRSPEQAKEEQVSLPLDPREMYSRDQHDTFWEDAKKIAGFIRDFAAQKKGLPIALSPHRRPRKMAPFRLYQLKGSDPPTFKLGVKFSSGEYWEQIYDGHSGWNLIHYFLQAPAGFKTMEVEWAYADRDGIFIPQRFEFRFADHESGVVMLNRHYILEESTLNAPIPDEQFTYAALGMPEDTRFVDKIENRHLVYHKRQLIPPTPEMAKVRQPPPIAVAGKSRLPLWIAINGMAIALILGVLAVRHVRHGRLRH
jgi:hypothetical protein